MEFTCWVQLLIGCLPTLLLLLSLLPATQNTAAKQNHLCCPCLCFLRCSTTIALASRWGMAQSLTQGNFLVWRKREGEHSGGFDESERVQWCVGFLST